MTRFRDNPSPPWRNRFVERCHAGDSPDLHMFMFACLQAEVEAAVKILLSLKADYKTATGKDWKPGQAPPATESAPTVASSASQSAADLNDQITKQGDLVRKLKAEKASKVCDAESLF